MLIVKLAFLEIITSTHYRKLSQVSSRDVSRIYVLQSVFTWWSIYYCAAMSFIKFVRNFERLAANRFAISAFQLANCCNVAPGVSFSRFVYLNSDFDRLKSVSSVSAGCSAGRLRLYSRAIFSSCSIRLSIS